MNEDLAKILDDLGNNVAFAANSVMVVKYTDNPAWMPKPRLRLSLKPYVLGI